MGKNELIFALSEVIQSDQPAVIQEFKRAREAKVKQAEDDIHKLCKKQYPEFLQTASNMQDFKDGLKKVRQQLGTIQENVSDVDRLFYKVSEEALKKQEELLQL